MKLLLHTCCAPCSIMCVEALADENISPVLFWYNPNIHPYTEYRSRREALRVFAKDKELPLLDEDVYGLRLFLNGAPGHSNEYYADKDTNGRCAFCYRLRLEKTAAAAKENGFDAFSTTLLISPYQNHELIRLIGEETAKGFGLEFVYRDFRPLFNEGRSRARSTGYYMQKYCGCIFSEEERYLGRGK